MKNKLENILEEYLKELIEELKPELKDRVLFTFDYDRSSNVLADTKVGLNPPVITFYLKSIANQIRPQVKKVLKDIITHEMIHCIQRVRGNKIETIEKEAYSKTNKCNFFK